MSTKLVWDKILSKIFIGYLQLVYRTSKIEIKTYNGADKNIINNCILGFWHGESYAMNLVIKRICYDNSRTMAIVTADKRGDYIKDTLEFYGVEALRMPDGIKIKGFLKELKNASKTPHSTMAIALDGPVGPLHEPKKLAFLLSNEAYKPFVGIKLSCSKKIILKRWDNYVIPLPFSKIKGQIYNFNVVNKNNLKEFEAYKGYIKEQLCS